MLSGNGRHRRPRQAPAIVVAAGVTGSAIALPLLGAVSAHAADGATWDRLAECESGGNWRAVLSNGHYGGLQLTQELWVTYGGLEYALNPDAATRAEQIAVAERVLADKGPQVWSECAVVAGLPGAGADPSRSSDPSGSGAPDSPSATPKPSDSPSGTANPSGASDSPSPSASASARPSPTPTGAGGSGQGGGGASDPVGGGSSDAGSSGGGVAGGDASGGHGRPGDSGGGQSGGGRTDDPADKGGAPGEDAREDGTYTVRPGDNLWAIAQAHDLDGGWPALYAANKTTIGADPDLILPGQQLRLD